MLVGGGVFARMSILGIVAAPDVSTGPAEAKMNPGVAHGEALLAAVAAGGDVPHQALMCALSRSSGHFQTNPIQRPKETTPIQSPSEIPPEILAARGVWACRPHTSTDRC